MNTAAEHANADTVGNMPLMPSEDEQNLFDLAVLADDLYTTIKIDQMQLYIENWVPNKGDTANFVMFVSSCIIKLCLVENIPEKINCVICEQIVNIENEEESFDPYLTVDTSKKFLLLIFNEKF